MVNISELKAEMARNNYTQEKLAKVLGITTRTLSNKMQKRVFGTDEMEKMIVVLNIKEPMKIFFNAE